MQHALAAVLLVTSVVGAVARPWRAPAWAVALAAAGIELAARTITFHAACSALRPLASPLAFVLCAVPLALMLDDVGVFEELARRAARNRRVVGVCWVLAGAVVALLNLDAAVVLLTPLYIRTARRVDLDPLMLAFQPVLLAMLASSVLPVSNLTNLIATSRFSLTTPDFLRNLALPSVVASAVGWFAYRRVFPARATARDGAGAPDVRALVIGGIAIALFLGLLVGGAYAGLAAWVAALVAIAFLAVFTRRVPWRRAPFGTVVLAGALGVVAAAAAAAFPHLLSAAGDGGVRGFGAGVVTSGVLNNLPATLVTLPHVSHTARVWPLLLGLNVGPGLVLTGSLAGLLWQASARAAGESVSAGRYTRVGVVVTIPAMVAGAAVLLLR